MATLVLEGEQYSLPNRILKKFKGKKIEILETDEGILIKPAEESIKQARGILKGCHFNSKTYNKQKQKDKELET